MKPQKTSPLIANLGWLLLFIVIITPSYAQVNNVQFDSIFQHLAAQKPSVKTSRALNIADSLYLHADEELQQVKALMLSADLLEKDNQRKEAIKYAEKALVKAKKLVNYQWQARIYGFLSTQHRTIGLRDQGKKYLEKGIQVSEQITAPEIVNQYKGITYQEMAYYAMDEADYQSAVTYLKLSKSFFERLQNKSYRLVFLQSTHEMLGKNYLLLNDFDSALYYYHIAENMDSAYTQNTEWSARVHYGLGQTYLLLDDYEKAKKYLHNALDVAVKLNHKSLLVETYRSLASYAKQKGNYKQYAFYEEKHTALREELTDQNKLAVNEVFKGLQGQSEASASTFFWTWVLLIFCSSLGVISYLIFSIGKRKFSLVDELETDAFVVHEPEAAKTSEHKSTESFITAETENELLQKLKAFEDSLGFLDGQMSRAMLAGLLNTNSKYLRYVIKTHKKKDFKAYINHLRIAYVVNKLHEDETYLQYKISYLAEETGFSSHTKFTESFKTYMHMTPSQYIKNLKDESARK